MIQHILLVCKKKTRWCCKLPKNGRFHDRRHSRPRHRGQLLAPRIRLRWSPTFSWGPLSPRWEIRIQTSNAKCVESRGLWIWGVSWIWNFKTKSLSVQTHAEFRVLVFRSRCLFVRQVCKLLNLGDLKFTRFYKSHLRIPNKLSTFLNVTTILDLSSSRHPKRTFIWRPKSGTRTRCTSWRDARFAPRRSWEATPMARPGKRGAVVFLFHCSSLAVLDRQRILWFWVFKSFGHGDGDLWVSNSRIWA